MAGLARQPLLDVDLAKAVERYRDGSRNAARARRFRLQPRTLRPARVASRSATTTSREQRSAIWTASSAAPLRRLSPHANSKSAVVAAGRLPDPSRPSTSSRPAASSGRRILAVARVVDHLRRRRRTRAPSRAPCGVDRPFERHEIATEWPVTTGTRTTRRLRPPDWGVRQDLPGLVASSCAPRRSSRPLPISPICSGSTLNAIVSAVTSPLRQRVGVGIPRATRRRRPSSPTCSASSRMPFSPRRTPPGTSESTSERSADGAMERRRPPCTAAIVVQFGTAMMPGLGPPSSASGFTSGITSGHVRRPSGTRWSCRCTRCPAPRRSAAERARRSRPAETNASVARPQRVERQLARPRAPPPRERDGPAGATRRRERHELVHREPALLEDPGHLPADRAGGADDRDLHGEPMRRARPASALGARRRGRTLVDRPHGPLGVGARITHDTRIGEVEIISMLMPSSASASNMSAATPG